MMVENTSEGFSASTTSAARARRSPSRRPRSGARGSPPPTRGAVSRDLVHPTFSSNREALSPSAVQSLIGHPWARVENGQPAGSGAGSPSPSPARPRAPGWTRRSAPPPSTGRIIDVGEDALDGKRGVPQLGRVVAIFRRVRGAPQIVRKPLHVRLDLGTSRPGDLPHHRVQHLVDRADADAGFVASSSRRIWSSTICSDRSRAPAGANRSWPSTHWPPGDTTFSACTRRSPPRARAPPASPLS